MIILIDSGILGILSNPNESEVNTKCEEWLYNKITKGCTVVTSQICKYEVKRSLILCQKKNSLQAEGLEKLADLEKLIDFIPMTEEDIDIACQLWADSIIVGIQVAPQQDINFDLIICSQWQRLKTESPGREITIATHNIRHLKRFAHAELWENL